MKSSALRISDLERATTTGKHLVQAGANQKSPHIYSLQGTHIGVPAMLRLKRTTTKQMVPTDGWIVSKDAWILSNHYFPCVFAGISLSKICIPVLSLQLPNQRGIYDYHYNQSQINSAHDHS